MKSHAELIERWGDVLQEVIEHIPVLYEKYTDPNRKKSRLCSFLHTDYREVAVLDYLINRNVEGFKENLRKAVPFQMELFEQYNRGEEIDLSLISMDCFKELFDALASGDMTLAKEFANHLGGKKDAEEYDDEFVLSLGYSLKYAVENNMKGLKTWLPRLKECCENPENQMTEFMGYPLVLEAFLEQNAIKAEAAFQVLLAGHKKKCQSRKGPDYGPFFYDSPDADLFVWGIGLANLCRHQGLAVKISDPLVPGELLIR